MYFKVAPRQTISAAVLPKVRIPLVLHYSQVIGPALSIDAPRRAAFVFIFFCARPADGGTRELSERQCASVPCVVRHPSRAPSVHLCQRPPFQYEPAEPRADELLALS